MKLNPNESENTTSTRFFLIYPISIVVLMENNRYTVELIEMSIIKKKK